MGYHAVLGGVTNNLSFEKPHDGHCVSLLFVKIGFDFATI
jgi:hypothetical protein